MELNLKVSIASVDPTRLWRRPFQPRSNRHAGTINPSTALTLDTVLPFARTLKRSAARARESRSTTGGCVPRED